MRHLPYLQRGSIPRLEDVWKHFIVDVPIPLEFLLEHRDDDIVLTAENCTLSLARRNTLCESFGMEVA